MLEINAAAAKGSQGPCQIAIVLSRYNQFIGERLLKACLKTLADHGVDKKRLTLVHVPGAFEIPVTVKHLADKQRYDAIITLGAVVRGETPHFDYISAECARGLAHIAMSSGVPVIFGVLTVDSVEQALARSGDEQGNKGSEAALAALEMIEVLRQLDDA